MATVFAIISLLLVSYYRVEGINKIDTDDQIDTNHIITTKNGQIYDCVDFYQQPAFKNPLLKNLITSKALESKSIARAHTRKAPFGIGLKDGGCPFGSVPILRTNKEREHSKVPSQEIISSQEDLQEPDHYYAFVRTNDPNKHYNGVGGQVVVYNPKMYEDSQWSVTRMRLVNGQDSIEFGWMVNPTFFGDNNTHLYTRFRASGKGCFNLQCPGFVQVGKEVPLGFEPDKISQRGGDQYFWTLSIEKHKDDGNWWVTIGQEKYEIGYWPKNLFSSLVDVANQVDWGGDVHNPPNKTSYELPCMGCGYKPDYDTKRAAFISNATLVDEGFNTIPPPRGTVKYQTWPLGYAVQDSGYTKSFGRIIFFGGPCDPNEYLCD